MQGPLAVRLMPPWAEHCAVSSTRPQAAALMGKNVYLPTAAQTVGPSMTMGNWYVPLPLRPPRGRSIRTHSKRGTRAQWRHCFGQTHFSVKD